MESQFFVGRAIMGSDMGVRYKSAEETMMIKVRNVLLEERHSKRHFLTVIVKLHVVKL